MTRTHCTNDPAITGHYSRPDDDTVESDRDTLTLEALCAYDEMGEDGVPHDVRMLIARTATGDTPVRTARLWEPTDTVLDPVDPNAPAPCYLTYFDRSENVEKVINTVVEDWNWVEPFELTPGWSVVTLRYGWDHESATGTADAIEALLIEAGVTDVPDVETWAGFTAATNAWIAEQARLADDDARFFQDLDEVGLVFRLAAGQTETRYGPVRLALWNGDPMSVAGIITQATPGAPLHLSGPCTYTLDIPARYEATS